MNTIEIPKSMRAFEDLEPREKLLAVLKAVSRPTSRDDILRFAGIEPDDMTDADEKILRDTEVSDGFHQMLIKDEFWALMKIKSESVHARIADVMAQQLREGGHLG